MPVGSAIALPELCSEELNMIETTEFSDLMKSDALTIKIQKKKYVYKKKKKKNMQNFQAYFVQARSYLKFKEQRSNIGDPGSVAHYELPNLNIHGVIVQLFSCLAF